MSKWLWSYTISLSNENYYNSFEIAALAILGNKKIAILPEKRGVIWVNDRVSKTELYSIIIP